MRWPAVTKRSRMRANITPLEAATAAVHRAGERIDDVGDRVARLRPRRPASARKTRMPEAGARTGSEAASGVAAQRAGGTAAAAPAITPRSVRKPTSAAASAAASRVADIRLAAEFEGGGVAGKGMGRSGKRPASSAQGRLHGLVERIVAGFVGEQDRLGAEERRERGEVSSEACACRDAPPPPHRNAGRGRDRRRMARPSRVFFSTSAELPRLPGLELGPQGLADQADIGVGLRAVSRPSTRSATFGDSRDSRG